MEISRPCISMESTIAKSGFDCDFDMQIATSLLEAHRIFGEVRYSERLGMLKTYGKANLTLSSNGDVVLKPVGNKEEAFLFFKRLGMILLPAKLCKEENIALLNCMRVTCDKGCWKTLRLKDEKDERA
ncbi:hypothetical protein HQ545_07445 [Candidatus Woesearchaeota archaeon]|nr:hypothetical protein [Candidatus Woesearchaeota archaeon]